MRGLGVRNMDKSNSLSGARGALGFHPVGAPVGGRRLWRTDLSLVQGDLAARGRPSRTRGAVEGTLCPMFDPAVLQKGHYNSMR